MGTEARQLPERRLLDTRNKAISDQIIAVDHTRDTASSPTTSKQTGLYGFATRHYENHTFIFARQDSRCEVSRPHATRKPKPSGHATSTSVHTGRCAFKPPHLLSQLHTNTPYDHEFIKQCDYGDDLRNATALPCSCGDEARPVMQKQSLSEVKVLRAVDQIEATNMSVIDSSSATDA